ncbi:hypothetical protein M0804_013850 [Polistes exclamans]|nr:hypothetical protein M0804_013850 [Polistes exclamans]
MCLTNEGNYIIKNEISIKNSVKISEVNDVERNNYEYKELNDVENNDYGYKKVNDLEYEICKYKIKDDEFDKEALGDEPTNDSDLEDKVDIEI